MLKNYIKIAFRNIKRYPLRNFIHFFGLAIGITVCFVVFKLTYFEYSFDTFHKDADRIYRVNTQVDYFGDGATPNPGTPAPLAEAIENEITGIEVTAPLTKIGTLLVRNGAGNKDLSLNESIAFADNGFFKIFDYNWLAGEPSTALTEPNSVVLTEESAKKYFGDRSISSIIGNDLLYGDTLRVIVKGVVADQTRPTDFIFTDFLSNATLQNNDKNKAENKNWSSINSYSQLFVKLYPEQELATLNRLSALNRKYVSGNSDWIKGFSLEPLQGVHFFSTFNGHKGSKKTLNGLMLIGLLILIIACVNFINLETAQAKMKMKEVGIRKSLGSSRKQLIAQFLIETYLIILMAIIGSALLSNFVILYFDNLLPKAFSLNYFEWNNIIFFIGLSVFILFLCGLYPAFVISKYSPIKNIRSRHETSRRFDLNYFLRKNMIVIQFTFSIAFIIVVLAVKTQIDFLMNKDLGYNKESIVFIETPSKTNDSKAAVVKNEFLSVPGVAHASLSFDALMSGSLMMGSVKYEGEDEQEELELQIKVADTSYLPLHDIKILAGRNLRNSKHEIILNKTACEKLGVNDPIEAVGKRLLYRDREMVVVGVINDIHTRSMYENTKPTMFIYNDDGLHTLNVAISSGVNLTTVLAELQKRYKAVYPTEAYSFQFLDETVAGFYKKEKRLGEILLFATVMAIFLSLLGLFGLVSFTISQRLKEISIRKVLGASITNILALISKEYVLLVSISFVLAVYPAWYFLTDWFNGFQYKIDMPVGIYLFSGALALLLSLAIVIIHSLKAASTNPAKVLKDE